MKQLVALGIMACSLDALTTWACLTYSTQLIEATPLVATLISSWGLIPALSFTVLARIAILGFMAWASSRAALLYWPSAIAIILLTVLTGWTAWSNYQFLIG